MIYKYRLRVGNDMENIIEIKNLKKYFNEVKAVDDISFTVHKGSLFAFPPSLTATLPYSAPSTMNVT